jgi:hypothetical protein
LFWVERWKRKDVKGVAVREMRRVANQRKEKSRKKEGRKERRGGGHGEDVDQSAKRCEVRLRVFYTMARCCSVAHTSREIKLTLFDPKESPVVIKLSSAGVEVNCIGKNACLVRGSQPFDEPPLSPVVPGFEFKPQGPWSIM